MQLASGNRCDQRREGHSSSAHAQNDGGSEGKVLLEKEPELRADMSQGESVPNCHVQLLAPSVCENFKSLIGMQLLAKSA